MAAESNVGARLLLIGKDGVLAGIKEITAATANLNKTIAEGATSSKTAAAGYAEQGAGLEALQAKMTAYEAQLGAVSAETDSLARLGKVAFFTLAAAGAAWTYESIKWAQNYQTALVQLRTQAGLTVTAMNAIGAAAMKNASSLGISPTAYVQAAYHPASTGYGVAQTIAITNYGAKLAAIGGSDVEDTVNALTSTMKAYGFNTNQTGHTAALLNAIVGAGNMHWSDLNSALSSGIASTAKTFGVSLPSVGGALARLTDLGTPAAQAGTRLRMALALIGAPTQESDKLLKQAGLDSTDATAASSAMASALVSAGLTTTQLSGALRNNSGAGGIYNALELLHQHLSSLSPEAQSALLSRAFGGGRMGTSIMQLYSNLPALKAKSAQIDKGSTNQKFMKDWATETQTLDFQLHKLGATLETLGTQFGTKLLPYVTDTVKVFSGLLTWFDKNKSAALGLGAAITLVLGPAIGVYLKRQLLSSQGAIMSVLNAYKRLILGQSAEDAALARTDGALGVNDAALAVNARAAAADAAASGAGGVGGAKGLKPLLGGAAGKSRLGALTASITTPLLNQFLGPKLSKTLGNRGKTDLMDALSGAQVGMFLGPEGALAGAGIGALYGERGHLKSDLGAVRSQITSAGKGLWDDLGLGGGSPPPPRTRAHIVAHLYVDGKEITNSVKQNVKRTANRK